MQGEIFFSPSKQSHFMIMVIKLDLRKDRKSAITFPINRSSTFVVPSSSSWIGEPFENTMNVLCPSHLTPSADGKSVILNVFLIKRPIRQHIFCVG